MRVLIRLLFFGLVAAGLGAMIVGYFASYADGPIGPFPGGRLRGLVRNAPLEWSSLADVDALDLQVNPDDPRSVRVWFVVENNTIYVPSAWASRKEWPAQVVVDPRVVIRAGDRLYERNAVRVTDPALVADLIESVSHKYQMGRGDPESTWFFRLDPPR